MGGFGGQKGERGTSKVWHWEGSFCPYLLWEKNVKEGVGTGRGKDKEKLRKAFTCTNLGPDKGLGVGKKRKGSWCKLKKKT